MLVVKEYTGPVVGPGRVPSAETQELIQLLQKSANDRKSYEISVPDEKTRSRWVAALRKHAPRLKIKVKIGTAPGGGLVVTATPSPSPVPQTVDSSSAGETQTAEIAHPVPQGTSREGLSPSKTPDVSGPAFSDPEVAPTPRKRTPRKKVT